MQIAKLLIDRRIDGTKPDGHPCHMLLENAIGDRGKIEILQCSFLNDGAGRSLIKFTDGCVNEKVIDIVSLYGECSIAKSGKNQYIATVMNNNCKLAQILSESGCILTSAVPKGDHLIEWKILGPNSKFISNFVSRIKSEGYGVITLLSEGLVTKNLLTDKQDRIIEYAYENGYFDTPKKIYIDDLCKVFGCSKSTLSVTLNMVEKKIIGLYLNTGIDNCKYREK